MELHRVDADVLAGDPFWSAVRRRHPDLTVVLLPDEPPDERPPTAPDEARRHLARLADAWAGLVPLLAGHGATGSPSARWAHRDGGRALVVERSLTGVGTEGGADLLRAVARHLGEQGWGLAPTTERGHPVLRATDGVLHLHGEAGAAVTTLGLSTPPLHLPEQARRATRSALLGRLAAVA